MPYFFRSSRHYRKNDVQSLVLSPTPLNVLPEGDSITNGNGDTQSIDQGGYRTAIGDYFNTIPHGRVLQAVGPNNNFFPNGQGAHNGVVGSTIVDHISTLPTMIGTYNVGLIDLMLGTNDLFNDPASTALTNMATLLAGARGAKPSVRIILSTIVDNSDSTMHGKILTFNAGLPSVVATENAAGGHVDLVDNYTAVGLYSVVNFFDGTHPNHVGYAFMVPVWQAAIDYRIQNWV